MIESTLAIAAIASIAAGYVLTWRHSTKVSATIGRPTSMTVGFAIASVAFLPITLMYWTARRLLLGRRP